MNYLVIDAGGNRWNIEAEHALEVVDEFGRCRVVFSQSSDKKSPQVASFSGPTSWGPAPLVENPTPIP